MDVKGEEAQSKSKSRDQRWPRLDAVEKMKIDAFECCRILELNTVSVNSDQ